MTEPSIQPGSLSEASIPLGKTSLQIPPMGIGAWAWGDRFMWGYGRGYSDPDVRLAFDASLAAGINFFDTAEVYGNGKSERLLGQFIASAPAAQGEAKPIVVATKFFPFPWRLWKGTLLSALRRSLKRLALPRVDLYQVHMPLPPVPVESWAEALAEAVKEGLTAAVGVSNYNVSQMRRVYAVLDRHGIPLASNQVEYSLLERSPERTGLLDACRELGITLIAYSPIAKGMLSGKYTPSSPPTGMRSRIYSTARLAQIEPLIQLLRDIGRAHDGKTPVQVSLNWLICKGAVPIPGAKTASQAQDLAGALGWRLEAAEVAALDEASQKLQ